MCSGGGCHGRGGKSGWPLLGCKSSTQEFAGVVSISANRNVDCAVPMVGLWSPFWSFASVSKRHCPVLVGFDREGAGEEEKKKSKVCVRFEASEMEESTAGLTGAGKENE